MKLSSDWTQQIPANLSNRLLLNECSILRLGEPRLKPDSSLRLDLPKTYSAPLFPLSLPRVDNIVTCSVTLGSLGPKRGLLHYWSGPHLQRLLLSYLDCKGTSLLFQYPSSQAN